MATCLCPIQPCEKHKFPFVTKEEWQRKRAEAETVGFRQFLEEMSVPESVIKEMEEK